MELFTPGRSEDIIHPVKKHNPFRFTKHKYTRSLQSSIDRTSTTVKIWHLSILGIVLIPLIQLLATEAHITFSQELQHQGGWVAPIIGGPVIAVGCNVVIEVLYFEYMVDETHEQL